MPNLYIHLYHGRKDPNEDLDDWGEPGPTFGPYDNIQVTYRDHVKMHADGQDTFHELMWGEGDLIHYNGMYYGDVEVFTFKSDESDPMHWQEYDPGKAREILVVEKVDLALLDRQRLALAKATLRINEATGKIELRTDEVEALLGIVNMLDEWSDKRAEAQKK